MSEVELRGATKGYGSVQAVRGLDLVAPAGALTALLGPSGCGKTTTLRLVAGLEAPDEGQVLIEGDVVAGPGRFLPPERRRVGMLLQQLALFPHLDVARNVAYGLRGQSSGARRGRVAELLELVGLPGYEGRFPDQLSGGQAQRVALARALAPRPRVMLLDEPFASLDVSLRGELRSEVRRILRAEGVTALLVTHDQDEALALGDRVAVMLEGCIAQVGIPDQVYRQPASPAVAAFVGQANFVEAQVQGGVAHTELGPVAVDAGDGSVLVLLRPEDLELVEAGDGPGTVVDVEYYGHDQLVTVTMSSGLRLRARLPAGRRHLAGSRVRLEPKQALMAFAVGGRSLPASGDTVSLTKSVRQA